MPIKTHKYTNGEITVIWKPVFDPRRKPWIEMDKATTEQIIEQVKKCPSGALSIAEKEG